MEQLGGQRMAEQMRTLERWIAPSPHKRSADDRSDHLAIGNATARRPHPDKHLLCRAQGSACTKVGDQRVASLVWQRQAVVARPLTPEAEFPRVPIQIVQGQGRDVTGPLAQPGQQE